MNPLAAIIRRALYASTVLLAISPGLSRGQVNTFVEDFTTTVYKDPVGTTADWNTGSAELKLFPFVPTLAGFYDTSSAENVHVAGDHAFVADGGAGLLVVDISDPAAPALVGAYDTGGFANTVDVSGNHAFVGDGNAGLQVIDISDPTTPVLAGTYNTGGFARGVRVSGDHVYVADGTPGLVIIDISDPAAPTFVATQNTSGYARGVAVAGDHAYVADGTAGLQVIDISNPAAPALAGTQDTPGDAYGVCVSGDRAYVADNTAGLQVIDISDPAAPALAGALVTQGIALGVTVSGDQAYVADDTAGLQVIDISNPAAPVLVFTYDTAGNAKGVHLSGDLAYVADGATGLRAIITSMPAAPLPVGAYGGLSSAGSIHVSGDHAYVGAGTVFHVIDISDPGTPTVVGTHNVFDTIRFVEVSGDHAYVGHEGGLKVIDISDPTAPVQAGSQFTFESVRGVQVSGDHAYLANNTDGLLVVDITDPASPTTVGGLGLPGASAEIAISGNYAYVASYNSGLHVVDISNPDAPALAGFHDESGAGSVFVAGDHAYLGADDNLRVIDISDPTTPVLSGTYYTSDPVRDVHVIGTHAYLAHWGAGLEVVDISNPASPSGAGSYDSPGVAEDLYVSGDDVYLADSSSLQVVRVYQREMDTDRDRGQSLSIDTTDDTAVRARVTATQVGSVDWEVTADDGSHWMAVPADSGWIQLSYPGSDLLWRSVHHWSPGVNPAVSHLTVEWLNDFARIESIADIPGDQGRQVRLEWLRSGHDFVGDATQIVEYAVYREIDPALSLSSPVTETRSFDDLSPAARGNARMMRASGWDFVTTVPVLVEDHYSVVVPTLADSSIVAGSHMTTFRVTALTATPGVFFHSPPDSGYSVDNLAPSVPGSLQITYGTGSGNTLSWDESPDADFQHFRVYRSTLPDFVPTPSDLVHSTTSTEWVDPDHDAGGVYYRVTAIDFSGNESEPAAPDGATSAPAGVLPSRWALHGNAPNPFHPQTRIGYSVPAGGGEVTLRVYNVGGRLIRSLVAGPGAPGERSVIWDGRDDRGRAVASGVYLYRLTTDSVALTRKMVLAR